MAITIKVTRNGRGESGRDVHISWGWTHSNARTDSNGYVTFNVSGGRGTIMVDGDVKRRDIQIGDNDNIEISI